ncbi:tyrosine-type recombinase/integrase [Microbacterium immunditiarum]|uniref:Integrase n=1 Tax=Microbacterium immunditiarum TaxID=337480 RepID=A0A7Y9GN39_9MICO|nr:tyrosine-type recombinase/integrase [Microbacterium immunditiarum]NYE19469.1 integrase [Microbacterium immunditiarum]
MTKRRANNHGSVYPYKDHRGIEKWRIAYWVDLPNGERARRTKKGFPSTKAAELALEEIRVDLRRGHHVDETRETLNSYAEKYFDALRVRPTTLAGYRKHFRVHIEPSDVGKAPISEITKDALNRFYRQLEKSGRKDQGHIGEPLSPATVRHIHVLVSQIMEHAVEDGVLRFNPAKRASPPTKLEAAPPEMTTWSGEDAATFLDWSESTGDYLWLAWLTLLGTGMRRGELLALRWRDVDFDNNVITVARAMSYVKEAGKKPVIDFKKPKSGRTRNIDIDSRLAEALRRRRDMLRSVEPELARGEHLIFTNRFGRPHNPVQFSRQWRERVSRARIAHPSLDAIHLHELRHTHATLLLRAGVHPKIVSERLGHADVQTTLNTYSHAVRTLQRDAADVVGRLLSSRVAPQTAPHEHVVPAEA